MGTKINDGDNIIQNHGYITRPMRSEPWDAPTAWDFTVSFSITPLMGGSIQPFFLMV